VLRAAMKLTTVIVHMKKESSGQNHAQQGGHRGDQGPTPRQGAVFVIPEVDRGGRSGPDRPYSWSGLKGPKFDAGVSK